MSIRNFFKDLALRRRAQSLADGYWQSVDGFDFAAIFPDRHEKQVRFTLDHVVSRMKPDDHVVDLGCSDGWHSMVVAPYCASLAGYDFSEKLIAQARAAAARAGHGHCSFEVANVLKLSLPRASADIVLLSGLTTCMVHDRDARRSMALAGATLKPGGAIMLKDTLNRGTGTRLNVLDTYAAAYRDRESYGRLLAEAGIEIVAEDWLNDDPEIASLVALGLKR